MTNMNDPPGTIPSASVRQHPRRPPAHRSVSLRHSPPPVGRIGSKVGLDRQPTNLSSPNPASDKANPPSASPKLLSNKHSSGESSDAGKWFETTNNNARQNSASFVDNEPPFFLRNSSSSETPPDGQSSQYARMRSAMPYRPGLAHMGTDGSSTEDFRSVIDDLTIANKKLKQKLRKYERVHDAHLQEEKLFEVRFHGLPDHKKKELEETLRKFAAELDDGATSDYPQIPSFAPPLEHQKSASSTSRFAESGYASMSASGQNSSAPSNQALNQPEPSRKMTRSAYNRQQQNIQSYLHDIPIGLLPNNNVAMTDKSKRKLVVRRLEQIFAGKRSAPGSHPQPMQQEEVAQSAASADRQEREATGRHLKPEGSRVARILAERDDEQDATGSVDALQKFRPTLHIGEQDFAGSGSPDQRPTRPLDLDPFRAQVPGENMDYIRHLGFTPPDMDTGDAPEEGHGWLYLNLLINMAQLHTLNVTPEFVKDALTDYSNHLELSRDGRKIRWKGGLDVTRNSSDSSSEQYSGGSPDDPASPSKRVKTEDSRELDESRLTSDQKARKLARAKRESEMNKFAYTPMFFHKEESEEDDEYYGFEIESSDPSFQRPHNANNSSRIGSSAVRSGSSSNKKREDGPMIFYTKARFCTDLSGDRLGGSNIMPGAYEAVTSYPLGASTHALNQAYSAGDLAELRGPFDSTPMDTDSTSGSRAVSSDEYFGFSPEALQNHTGSESPEDVMDFQASGLGGVQPEDNFSINVRRSQTQTASSDAVAHRRSSIYPKKILDVLQENAAKERSVSPTSPQHIIKEELLSASRKSLPNSALPPASFLPFDSTSSNDVDSDYDSDVSSEEDSESGEGPATALQLLNISPNRKHIADNSIDSSEEASEYSADSDDGSIDFLATARQMDPTTVRTQEREYDAALADRLAEEIVAGSSAATAGGGSGFNSPAVRTNLSHSSSARKKRQSTTSGSMSSRAKLKRARTSESLGKKGTKGAKSLKVEE
ncbi:frequency clock protein [Paraphoma chrysanthemicola]|uniref:Frequency clock protein n=1 Tax=Paraphoma chrysanthemicola TaxID=798071 RepID=A0A8K0QZL2_9PLEO|nr:frequency clock protein [Paraphoma chrysanthemicola]